MNRTSTTEECSCFLLVGWFLFVCCCFGGGGGGEGEFIFSVLKNDFDGSILDIIYIFLKAAIFYFILFLLF